MLIDSKMIQKWYAEEIAKLVSRNRDELVERLKARVELERKKKKGDSGTKLP